MRTSAVPERTALLLVRHRFHLVAARAGKETPLLAEDCAVLAFTGEPTNPNWLATDTLGQLLTATVDSNVSAEAAREFLKEILDTDRWRPHLDDHARQRAAELLEAHERVRTASRMRGVRHRVVPQLPPDLLGVYLLLPVIGRRS
jgi:hypothetical protein